jgi:hypothetical protein
MVLVEARVLCGDDSMLEIGRDLVQRNEFVSLAIGGVANLGLKAALHVHHGCRWVDPPGGQKQQCGKRPQKHHTDDKPSEKGSDETLPKGVLGGASGASVTFQNNRLGSVKRRFTHTYP